MILLNEIYFYYLKGGIVEIILICLSIILWTLIFERIFFLNSKFKIVKKIYSDLLNKNKVFSLTEITNFKLNKNLKLINILIVISPLLGLLGTVFGLVYTFDVINIYGTGNIKLLADGISKALITTELGLVIAIPGFLFYKQLIKKIKKIKYEIDLIEFLIKRKKINT